MQFFFFSVSFIVFRCFLLRIYFHSFRYPQSTFFLMQDNKGLWNLFKNIWIGKDDGRKKNWNINIKKWQNMFISLCIVCSMSCPLLRSEKNNCRRNLDLSIYFRNCSEYCQQPKLSNFDFFLSQWIPLNVWGHFWQFFGIFLFPFLFKFFGSIL